MKRIAAHIGLTAFCALAVAFYLPDNLTMIVMACAAAAAFVFLLIKKTRRIVSLPLAAIVIALSCGVNLTYTALAVTPVQERLCGEEQRIEATLTDEPYRQYARYCYRLTTDTVNEEAIRVKVLLKTERPLDIEPYDHLSFTADISATENNYYLSKGYFISVKASDIRCDSVQDDAKPLYYHAIRLRRSMREAIEAYLPVREAELCNAILIGDKYGLDSSVKDGFREIGASHFVVVSGMHFSILCCLCLLLFRKIFRKTWIYYPLTYVVIFLYMMVTGFQPSVMRSGIMMLILTTGRWALRLTDSLTSLGVAGFLMPFIFSPYGCGDMGMILSFAATFSIIVWATPIYHKLCIHRRAKHAAVRLLIKMTNGVIAVFSTCLAAAILVIPLSVFLFNGFSVMTLISSMLLYPLIWLIMVFSLLVSAFFYLGHLRVLSLICSWLLYFCAKLTLWLVDGLSSIPFAYIRVRSLWFYLWMAVTLALGIAAYCLRGKYRLYRAAALVSSILFFGGLTINFALQAQINRVDFYVGKEGAVVSLNRSGRLYLLQFDCDYLTSYQTIDRIEDDFGEIESAFCTTHSERANYNRLFDREIAVSHYLMYRNVNLSDYDTPPEETFAGCSTFVLDDGVILQTAESSGKLLLYLTDGDRTMMILPKGYPPHAIPEDMRRVDILLLNKPATGYDQLSCDSLILCCDATANKDQPLPSYDHLYTSEDAHITFDMN